MSANAESEGSSVGRRDAHHGSRLALWLPVALVLGVLAAAGVAFWLDRDLPDPTDDPAAVAAPPGLALPALSAPEPVAEPAQGTLDPAKVRRAVARLLRDQDLGPDVLATVAGLDGSLLYSSGTGTATPASTLKLLTTAAALEALGPDHTFATTVVADGPGRIVLVGGGDPLLASSPADRDQPAYPQRADVATLAKATARAMRDSGRTRVRLGYDASLFSGPAVNPHWPDTYVPEGVVAPISALWVDEGRPATGLGRVDDPAATAATAFAAALDRAGIDVVGRPQTRRAAPDAAELARVTSAPVSQIVEQTLLVSDNEAAEVLSRQVGLATSGVGSSAAGARGVLEVLGTLGVPTDGARVYDGSGLSRDDLLDPDTLSALLQASAAVGHPELRAILTGLPVAGFNGSLADRFDDQEQGRGLVRAKTGTLSGVSGLAGTVTDRDGRPMVFALLADRVALVDTLDARDALDAVSSALAGCRCGG
jgi:D-alanyl-D-alanine carboxypeptidase/D-alanyl-D-alanine-endopeptidase (penicillin-binding protein 4)